MVTGRRTLLTQLPLMAALPRDAEQAPRSRTLGQRLLKAVEELEIIDTHEHIIAERDRLAQPVDFFTLAGHYALNDVISAGLAAADRQRIENPHTPLAERWRAFEPYWKHARLTGYGQALRIAIGDIYGFEEISGSNLARINDAIRSQNKPGFYRSVLRQRAKIRFAVLDDYWNAVPVKPDQELFVMARKFDRFVLPASPRDVRQLEELTGVSITSLTGLKQALEKSFQQALEAGMVTVKSTIAYNRELLFQEVGETDAARDFEALMKSARPIPAGFRHSVVRPFRNLEDHLFHHVIRLADAHRLPVQVHTGLLAGNGCFVANTNARHLTNLFYLFPRVRFDLFHISYPYQSELAVLAKLFPNVYIDFCWAHVISPGGARRALHEFLDTVPANKIFGFGGDYRYPELSYAHARMARRNIAQVLAEKTEHGDCTEQEALELARLLLHDNPACLFSPPKVRS
jgi:glucuronate isomerase